MIIATVIIMKLHYLINIILLIYLDNIVHLFISDVQPSDND